MQRKLIPIAFLAALVAALTVSGASAVTTSSGSGHAGTTVTVRSSSYGQILFDSRGRALYAFTADPRGRSVCTGACAKAWPPYILSGGLRAPAGVDSSLLGTIRRSDGRRQVTFADRPLYYYVGDRKPGDVFCQNVREFGGLWLVVRANGALVR